MSTIKRVNIAKGDLAARQDHILDSAQSCFVRFGLQRVTIQDIAREAQMSPPNIYRYFRTKEAVVNAWMEREFARSGALIAQLGRPEGLEAIMLIADARIANLPREEAILRLEVWVELSRNAELAPLANEIDTLFRDWLVRSLRLFSRAPETEQRGLAATANALLKGMLVDRALLPDYDARPALVRLRALLDA